MKVTRLVSDLSGEDLTPENGCLCRNCHVGLGSFKDDPALLLVAVEYLQGGDAL